MVIDAHARIARGTSPDALLDVMEECGIGRAVVSAGSVIPVRLLGEQIARGGWSTTDADNESVLRAADSYPHRLTPLWFGNPHTGPAAYAESAGRCAGLELSPPVHGIGFTDDRVLALLDVARTYEHVVYAVCLPREGARVGDLVLTAVRYPDLRFALGHCGVGPLDLAAIDEIAPHPNIVVETSCTLYKTAQYALDILGPDRVLFGSEFPHQHPAAEIAKASVLTTDPGVRAAILGDSARLWLGPALRPAV